MNTQSWLIALVGLLWIVSPNAATATDRVVLIQPIMENDRPHYVTFAGGRHPDWSLIVIKEGRRAPADEWLMHELRPGVFVFQSHDPFFENWYLCFTAQRWNYGKRITDISPVLLQRKPSPDHAHTWEIQEVERGIFKLRSGEDVLNGEFLFHVTSPHSIDQRLIMGNVNPGFAANNRFRIIDVPPSKPSGQVAPKAD